MNYLLDTNIIVDHLRKKIKLSEQIVKENPSVSIITYAELIYGANKSINQQKAFDTIDTFFKDFSIEIINLSRAIIHKFGEIKVYLDRKGQRLEDFDVFIAATALSDSYILVTRNVSHFERIPELKLYEKPTTLRSGF